MWACSCCSAWACGCSASRGSGLARRSHSAGGSRGAWAGRSACSCCATCRCAGCCGGTARCSSTGNADCRAWAHAVIAVDIANVFRSRIFVDSSIIEHWRVINAIPIDRYCKFGKVRCRGIHSPRNGDHFPTTSSACATSAGRENGVRHAAGITVEHNVFDSADFFTLG
jgi:hypothetical protein